MDVYLRYLITRQTPLRMKTVKSFKCNYIYIFSFIQYVKGSKCIIKFSILGLP